MPQSFRPVVLLAVLAMALVAGGCRKKEPTCEPDSIEWGVSLVVGAGPSLNPNDAGEALPTAVRVFQLRGELAVEDLDFDAVWQAEKADELGEAFLTFEELTMFPDRRDIRTLPVDPEATHMLAAGLFREAAGNGWYSLFELPKRHGEWVCAKEPVTKIFPDPCFYIYLDRNELNGGASPPPGFIPDGVQCAPVGPPPAPEPKRRGLRDRKKSKEDLEDPLKSEEIDGKTQELENSVPKSPEGPKAPQTPDVTPDAPSQPSTPSVPKPK